MKALYSLVSAALALCSVGCTQRPLATTAFGPNEKASLAIYFNIGTTNADVENFNEKVLFEPSSSGVGSGLKPGLCLYSVLPTSEGHLAISVNYCANATADQKSSLEKAITASPNVFRVLHDIIPSQAKSIKN
jgi:hypothetical protein